MATLALETIHEDGGFIPPSRNPNRNTVSGIYEKLVGQAASK